MHGDMLSRLARDDKNLEVSFTTCIRSPSLQLILMTMGQSLLDSAIPLESMVRNTTLLDARMALLIGRSSSTSVCPAGGERVTGQKLDNILGACFHRFQGQGDDHCFLSG